MATDVFSEDTYDPASELQENEEYSVGHAKRTIRYRYAEGKSGGIEVSKCIYNKYSRKLKQSNAKLIKYKDGTFKILIGGTLLSLTKRDGESTHLFAVPPNANYLQHQTYTNQQLLFPAPPKSKNATIHISAKVSNTDRRGATASVCLSCVSVS